MTTKRLIFVVVAAALAAAAAPSSFSAEITLKDARTYTIKEAIRVAILNNKSVQIQEEELACSKGNVLYAVSQFLPKVNLEYDFKYTEAVLDTKPAPGHRKDTRIFTGYKSDNYAAVGIDETVYNGGANIATFRQAKLQVKAQEESLRSTKLGVEFETKRLFYGVLLAYETKRIAADLVEQARAHYDKTKQMFDQGTASKFDVLQSKTQVSRTIPQLVNAQNAIDLLLEELKKEMGVDMLSPIDVAGTLGHRPIKIDEAAFLKEAYAGNPDIIMNLLGIDISRWAIEFAKSGWYPQVSAKANFNYRSDDIVNMINNTHGNWYMGVKTSVAAFDGFATKAKVDEANARYNQSKLEEMNTIDQVTLDIKNACINMANAQAVIDAERDSVDEAKEALRLSEVRFANGVGINLDVFDCQVSLAQIEQYLAQGIYDYIVGKAQLDRSLGREFTGEETI
jgi:outer membrane protein TolC